MPPAPSFLKNIAADSGLALIAKAFAMPLAYLTNLVMARLYGAEQVGTYFIAFSLVGTSSILCCMGLNTGLLRFAAALKEEGKEGDIKRLFWQAIGVVALLSGLAASALYLCQPWLAARFRAPQLPGILGFMALGLPFSAATLLFNEKVRALGGVKWVVFQESLLFPLSFLSGVVILFYTGANAIGPSKSIGLAYLASIVLSLVFVAACPRGRISQKPVAVAQNSIQDLLWYSLPLFLSSLVGLSTNGLDSLILGWFTAPQDVAYYGIAVRTAPVIVLPLLAVNAVVPPQIARLYQRGDLKGLETLAQTTARWMYLGALPLTLLIILLTPELLGLFGPGFREAQFALIILAVGQFINVASGSAGVILAMTNNQWSLILVRSLVGGMAIPLMALCAAVFGLNGLALLSALAVAGVNILAAWAVWRRLKIKGFAVKVHWATGAALVGVGAFYLARPFVGPILGALLFTVVFLALLGKELKKEFFSILQPS